jgi:hypothetical protein
VCPAVWRAHGTARTVGPCVRQFTRGASASSHTGTVPRSSARQRRRPSPRSYQDERRPQRPQRPEARLVGRTDATTPPASSSNSMHSMTVFSTPKRARHRLAFRTPFSAPWFLFFDSSET